MQRITKNLDTILHNLIAAGIAALPTETVYGLGADATQDAAVKAIFRVKGRPTNHPLIMHVAEDWDLSPWVATMPDNGERLINAFWPGPLTLILPLRPKAAISPAVTAGQSSIAIRCPKHPLMLKLLQALKKPIVAPSANPFGKISPTSALDVLQDFPEADFPILDGGACQVGIESTIVDLTEDTACRILRPGLITEGQIAAVLGAIVQSAGQSTKAVSGNLKQHYQPRKPLFYFSSGDFTALSRVCSNMPESCLMHFSASIPNDKAQYRFPDCPEKAAQQFYHQLRLADAASNQGAILLELPPDTEAWSGLRDRIKKAGVPLYAVNS